jgi:hypothetical protein
MVLVEDDDFAWSSYEAVWDRSRYSDLGSKMSIVRGGFDLNLSGTV